VDYGNQEKFIKIGIVGLCVQGNFGIWFVDSTKVTMVINSNVKSTTCFPPHKRHHRTCRLGFIYNIRGVACTLGIEGVPTISIIDSDCGISDENGADLSSGSLACLCAGFGVAARRDSYGPRCKIRWMLTN